MLYTPTGEILVTESVPNGRVTVLYDKNNDFKADKERKVLIKGLDRPYGMAFWKDYLYVAETTSLKRYKYDAKALSVGKGEEIVNMADFGKGHWTRSLTFDPKGEKFYLGIGSESNVSPGEPERRAAISRCNPDGSGCELFATGTRNPTSIYFYPGTNVLWASVQERDGLGDDLVPDYFTHIQQGGFYGWPYAYFGPQRRSAQQRPKARPGEEDDHPGCFAGSPHRRHRLEVLYRQPVPCEVSGRRVPRAARIVESIAARGPIRCVCPVQRRQTLRPLETFLSGWMLDPGKREVWGRPTGVLVMKDGSLLVSDDGGNKIWRISYKK